MKRIEAAMWNYILELLNMSKGTRRFIASESILGTSMGIFVLVFNLHLLAIGLNEQEIGSITSIGTLVMGFFSIPSGILANYIGRKKILVSGLLLMGVGYLIVASGTEISTFYLAQLVISLGITLLINSEIQLLFSYSRSKKEETQAFSMLFAIFTLFTGVGTLLGGFIPKWFEGNTTTYQSALYAAAIFMFLVAFVRGILLPAENKAKKQINSFSFKNLKMQLTNRTIWILSFFTFIIGASYAILVPFLNIIVKFRLSWNDEYVSLFLTLNGFFLFLGSIIMPYLLDKWGSNKTYSIVYLINVIFSIVLFFSLPIVIFSILLLLRGGMFTMLNNLIDSHTMQATDEEERNLFAAMRTVLRSVGASIFNFIAGIILANKNYSLPFLLAGGLLLLGYIYYLFLVKPLYDESKNLEL